jgi:hypothetical protein
MNIHREARDPDTLDLALGMAYHAILFHLEEARDIEVCAFFIIDGERVESMVWLREGCNGGQGTVPEHVVQDYRVRRDTWIGENESVLEDSFLLVIHQFRCLCVYCADVLWGGCVDEEFVAPDILPVCHVDVVDSIG